VHQLIRQEYPDLVSVGKGEFIQLIPYDQEYERVKQDRKSEWFERTLTSQIGLRWVVEAMCPDIDPVLPDEYGRPNSFGDLDAVTSWNYPSVEMSPDNVASVTRLHAELVDELSRKKTVLVGHNLFLDLIYLYQCFIGPLPDKVEAFTYTLSYLFPLIVDTKYVADYINNNSPGYKSSLEELDQEISHLPVPLIGKP